MEPPSLWCQRQGRDLVVHSIAPFLLEAQAGGLG